MCVCVYLRAGSKTIMEMSNVKSVEVLTFKISLTGNRYLMEIWKLRDPQELSPQTCLSSFTKTQRVKKEMNILS